MTQLDRLKALAICVQAMRHAQKEYFRTRDRDVLNRSKSLERAADKLLPDALRADDLLEAIGAACIVSELPPARDHFGQDRMVTDVLPMLSGAIAVGGGRKRAMVKSDGHEWRVSEWLDREA